MWFCSSKELGALSDVAVTKCVGPHLWHGDAGVTEVARLILDTHEMRPVSH